MIYPSVFLIHSCTIQKRFQRQKLTYTAATGTPAVGQTVTGTTSHATAVIHQLFTGYLVVNTVVGTFTAGEPLTIGITWAATLGTQTNYTNSSGVKEYYWMDNQTGIPCRFDPPGKSPVVLNQLTGVFIAKPLSVVFPDTVTIAEVEYRIATTSTGFAGTYIIDPVVPCNNLTGIDHYEAALKREPNP